jgi:hypothetical protein
VRLALGLFRDARSFPAADVLDRWGPVIAEVARHHGREALESAMEYVLGVSKTDTPARILGAARTYGGPELEEVVMTVAERLRAEKAADVLLRQIRRKFGRVGHVVEPRVRAATPAEIDVALDRILEAERPEQLFD